METPLTLYDILQSGGVIAVLLIFVVGGMKRWWVWGWQYRQIEEQNAKWMELALRSTNLAESLDELARPQPYQPFKLP